MHELLFDAGDMGAEGGEALFGALGSNVTLTSLDISALQGSNRNHIGPKGAIAIAKALAGNKIISILIPALNCFDVEVLGLLVLCR